MTKKKTRKFSWFFVLLAIILLYFSSVLISQQFYLNQVNADQKAAEARLRTAKQENEALRQERDQLNDLQFIERVAREELGMTKPGELPYSSAGRK